MAIPTIIFALALLILSKQVFAHPGTGIVVTDEGTVYFAYGPGHRIWKVNPDGRAEPLVTGALDSDFRVPHALIADGHGHLITASDAGSVVWRVSADGTKVKIYPPGKWDGVGAVALGGDPFTIAPDGRIISIADDEEHAPCRLVIIALDGAVTPLAGGATGFVDGRGDAVGFGALHMSSFAWGPDGHLYMTEGGSAVRRVTLEGEVKTIAGGPQRGTREGRGREALFDGAAGLAVAPDGRIYVADSDAHRIRMIAPEGAVITFAGTGEKGDADGPADKATFDSPVGLTHAKDGSLYILEINFGPGGEYARIRRIDPDRNVTTITTVPADRVAG